MVERYFDCSRECTNCAIVDCESVIKMVSKQIPFKAKGTHIPICGVCNGIMDLAQGNLNYCPNCGQKIGW